MMAKASGEAPNQCNEKATEAKRADSRVPRRSTPCERAGPRSLRALQRLLACPGRPCVGRPSRRAPCARRTRRWPPRRHSRARRADSTRDSVICRERRRAIARFRRALERWGCLYSGEERRRSHCMLEGVRATPSERGWYAADRLEAALMGSVCPSLEQEGSLRQVGGIKVGASGRDTTGARGGQPSADSPEGGQGSCHVRQKARPARPAVEKSEVRRRTVMRGAPSLTYRELIA